MGLMRHKKDRLPGAESSAASRYRPVRPDAEGDRMSDNTKIEWCDATWNPITGCEPVSDGCANCYAYRMTNRFPATHKDGVSFDRAVFHEERLAIPLHWRKPRKIFVCSMGDMFYREVPSDWRCDVWGIMERCPQHTFMILTKRPANIDSKQRPVLNNVWIGVTAENQKQANNRIPDLISAEAALRFVSIEPMLGPVDLMKVAFPSGCYENVLRSEVSDTAKKCGIPKLNGIDWVICGGETGSNARPCYAEWIMSLSEQCLVNNVPFFFKKGGNRFDGFPVEDSRNRMRREYPKGVV